MIRKLQEVDWNSSLALTEWAFKLNLTDSERIKMVERIKKEPTLGYFEQENLAAKLVTLPLHIYVGGTKFSMGGIASVATWPEYRRRGMIESLTKYALQSMREQGQTLSMLNPFSFPFYRKFGWGSFSELKRYKYATNNVPMIPLKPGKVVRCESERYPEIKAVYESFASQYNGMLSRDDEWWERLIYHRKKGQLAIDYDEEENPRGYIIYKITEKFVDVKEFVYLDEFSRMRLLKHLSMLDSMSEIITYTVPQEDRLCAMFNSPPTETGSDVTFMARIVDFEAFLRLYPFQESGSSHSFLIKVEDRLATWNDGIFSIVVNEQGISEVNKCQPSQSILEAGSPTNRLQIAGPIEIFSSAFMGYGSFLDYIRSGLLRGEEHVAVELDKVVQGRTPYVMDMF